VVLIGELDSAGFAVLMMEAVILEIVVKVLIDGLEVWDGGGVFEIAIPSTDSFFLSRHTKVVSKRFELYVQVPCEQ
jgi:hypothetical protein